MTPNDFPPRPDIFASAAALASVLAAATCLWWTCIGAGRMYSVPWLADAGLVVGWLLVYRHFVKMGRLY